MSLARALVLGPLLLAGISVASAASAQDAKPAVSRPQALTLNLGDVAAQPVVLGHAWVQVVDAELRAVRDLPRPREALASALPARLAPLFPLPRAAQVVDAAQPGLVLLEGDAVAPTWADLRGESFVVGAFSTPLPWKNP
jgi:hypothetical protein